MLEISNILNKYVTRCPNFLKLHRINTVIFRYNTESFFTDDHAGVCGRDYDWWPYVVDVYLDRKYTMFSFLSQLHRLAREQGSNQYEGQT